MIMEIIEFLCALFYTTLYSTAVIIMILFFRKLFGAKLWSDGRMILWLLAVVVMIIPAYPNFLFSYMFDSYPIPPFKMRFNQIAELNNGFLIPTGDIEAVLSVWNGSGWNRIIWDGKITGLVVFSVWISCAAAFIVWQLIIYIKLRNKIRKFSYCDDDSIISYIKSERLFWGINRDIPVIIAPQKLIKGIKCPSVVGVRHPVIVIPSEQWQQLTSTERNAVITHELIHVKYNDNIKNYILLFIQAVHWFNPFVWLALKWLRQDIEAFRDSNIIRNLNVQDIRSYAGAILHIAELNSKKYSIQPHSGMLCTSGTGLRISLISAKNRKSVFTGILLTVLSAIIVFVIFYKFKLDIVGTYITVIP
jgi:beta-lactamase regulating signal transducer with metallopeptidase domain